MTTDDSNQEHGTGSISDRLRTISKSLKDKVEHEHAPILPQTKFGKLKQHGKKIAIGAIAAVSLGGIIAAPFAHEYITRRIDYPQRDVLYRATQVYQIAGKKSGDYSDQEIKVENNFYDGGEKTKVGTFLFRTTREFHGDISSYSLDNSQKIRVAAATRKHEFVQGGMKVKGGIDFNEQFAEPIIGDHAKGTDKYTVLFFEPDRESENTNFTLLMKDGERILTNKLTEKRSFPLGVLFGEKYRAGTRLEDYILPTQTTNAEQSSADKMIATIDRFNSPETTNSNDRQNALKEFLSLDSGAKKNIIYVTHEDGIIDWFPQGSTVYLNHDPSLGQRALKELGFKHTGNWFRVENHWDLFPGNYPILNKITFEGKDIVRPFAKYNNGGYTLEDKFGIVAEIKIKDFFLHYGQDVLYEYFLDVNGNGKIETNSEKVGSALCSIGDDMQITDDIFYGKVRSHSDYSHTLHISFMGNTHDKKKALEEFNLCRNIESCMPDQINRGFGKHSLLGYVNELGSDITLYNTQNIENMSRALTEESTLVAGHDIVSILAATHRPYTNEVAQQYGINVPEFSPSNELHEMTYSKPYVLAGGALAILAAGAFGFRWRSQRKEEKSKLSITDRIEQLKK